MHGAATVEAFVGLLRVLRDGVKQEAAMAETTRRLATWYRAYPLTVLPGRADRVTMS